VLRPRAPSCCAPALRRAAPPRGSRAAAPAALRRGPRPPAYAL